MKSSPKTIVFRALGTLALATGFVIMVGRVPFVADPPTGENLEAQLSPYAGSHPSELLPGPGTLQASGEIDSQESEIAVSAGLNPALSLFRADFAGADGSAGYATEEHLVPGTCADAGVRYIAEACPDCQLMTQMQETESLSTLMWTEVIDGEHVIKTVSKDCVATSPAGTPVVGTLTFGNGVADLTAKSQDQAVRRVPLLPGAIRVGAVEMGTWLATFDEVARPSSAIGEMATELQRRGWREAPDGQVQGTSFEGERVFTNNSDAFCVISLSKQGDRYQLVTVVSSQI